jgi:phospholipid/cholesterol/gamma-HCH transport system substrate-binding protein
VTSYRKNLMVGTTVAVGLVLLGILMLKFGALPAHWFGPTRIPAELHVARADGLSVGSSVNYLGVNVGNVTNLRRSADQTQVVIEVQLDEKNPPPANVVGRIRSQIVGGGSNISLEIPEGSTPTGRLEAHASIPTQFLGVDLLPPEFAQLAVELRLVAQQLRESKLTEHLDATLLTVRAQVEHAGKLIESLDTLVSDPKMREDLRTSLANLRTVTESANRIGTSLEKVGARLDSVATNADATITKTQGHIDELSKQMSDRLIQVSRLLEQFQSIAGKIDQGKGTAGLFINDPKLYENLVDTSKELNLTIADLKLLVKQWTDEGMYIKLNGKK